MKKKLTFISMCAAALALAGCSSSSGNNESTADKSTEATTKETGTDSQGTTKDQTAEQSTEGETTGETADVMSYAEYMAAEEEAPVKVDVFVQATQSWWDNKISVYAADVDGGYFIYDMACSQEDAEKLQPGTEILVSGFKGAWSGEIEIKDASFEIVDSGYSFFKNPIDVTEYLGTDKLIDHMNDVVAFKGLTVVPVGKNDSGEDAAFFYKWDNSGEQGDDLYFKVTDGKDEYTFTVESYLCGKDTEVYKAVEALETGDVIDMEGFLYWYEGPNPHITKVVSAGAADDSEYMSYADYMAAEIEDPVSLKVYVQATQAWHDDKISVYAADENGGYFIYDMACSQEDAAKLEPGTEIIVNGYKGEWSGEIEVKDATFEFGSDETGFYSTGDVAGMLGTDDIKEYMNQKVEFVQLEIVPVGKNDAGEDAAWFYKWDNSGSEGDDLYFKVTDGNGEYTFTVESSLCGPDTEVYKAVKELKVGDQVSFEGFLYWYEGPNPHITSVTIAE